MSHLRSPNVVGYPLRGRISEDRENLHFTRRKSASRIKAPSRIECHIQGKLPWFHLDLTIGSIQCSKHLGSRSFFPTQEAPLHLYLLSWPWSTICWHMQEWPTGNQKRVGGCGGGLIGFTLLVPILQLSWASGKPQNTCIRILHLLACFSIALVTW